MRKTLLYSAALALAVLTSLAQAGALSTIALGQGGGRPQKDATNGQEVVEKYDRGIAWSKPVSYSGATATSGVPLSVTMAAGYTSAYKGPWYVKIYNSGPTTGVFTPLTFSAAYTADLTAIGTKLTASNGAVNGVVIEGPLSQADYAHLRGLTDTATGSYQLGTVNQ